MCTVQIRFTSQALREHNLAYISYILDVENSLVFVERNRSTRIYC